MSHYALVNDLGYLPMQHVGAGRTTEGVQVGATIDLDQRYCMYGIRMIRRHCGPGDGAHYQDDFAARGDIITGCYWPSASEGLRPTGAWRFGAWPAIITIAGEGASFDARPVKGPSFLEDTRFVHLSVNGLRPYPVGTTGLVVDSSDEDVQTPLFFPAGAGPNVVQWRGAAVPTYSTFEYDIGPTAADKKLDPKRRARRDTTWRVVPWAPPIGFVGPPADDEDSCGLAWLLGATSTGRRGVGFGLVSEPIKGATGVANAEKGGPWWLPLHAVSGGDQHLQGINADGGVYPVHMSTQAIWRGPVGMGYGDGPVNFEGTWPLGVGSHPRFVEGHLSWDSTMAHTIPTLDATGSIACMGKWRIYTSIPYEPATPPGSPAMPANSVNEMGQPALSFFPQVTARDDAGYCDWRYQPGTPTPEQDAMLRKAPCVGRLEAYGARTSGEWQRTLGAPWVSAKYRVGEGNGGAAFLPPQMRIEDVLLGSLTVDANYEPSTSWLAACRTGLAVCREIDGARGSPAAGWFTYHDGTVIRTQMRDDNGVASTATWAIQGTTRFDGNINLTTSAALGAGAAANLGLTGGQGPANPNQNLWVAIQVNGVTTFLAGWR